MKKIIKESELKNIISEAIENYFGEEEVDRNALADFCLNNDFLFIANGGAIFGGMKVRVANTTNIQQIIASEVLRAERLEITHEADNFLENRYISENAEVVKVILPDEEYYIVWER